MNKKKELTYNEAIKEIEMILEKMENDEPDVDELSQNVKRVTSLIKFCKEKLHNTESEIAKTFEEIE